MNDFGKILIVSRVSKHCRKAVHLGFSLARKYRAHLDILHVMNDPFHMGDWDLVLPYDPVMQQEYATRQRKIKGELDDYIRQEKSEGISVQEHIEQGKPEKHILKFIEDNDIDLVVMLQHKEGPFAHLLSGHINEKIIRKMPCSILLVRADPV